VRQESPSSRGFFGSVHVCELAVIDSTQSYLVENIMDEAKKIWYSGCMDVFVVSANHQTSGRGKGDRQWFSSDTHKCFALSFLLPFPVSLTARGPLITQILALSALETINELVSRDAVHLKWPNDLIIEGRKVGGILAEMYPDPDMHAVVIGIGVNLDIPVEYLESGIRASGRWPPGSVRQLTGVDLDRRTLYEKLIQNFLNKMSDMIRNEGDLTPSVLHGISSHQVMVGQKISFHDGNKTLSGIHRGISEGGGLVVDSKIFYSGELIPSD